MKIKYASDEARFEELAPGETFLRGDNGSYVKCDVEEGHKEFNAVALLDGRLALFTPECRVQRHTFTTTHNSTDTHRYYLCDLKRGDVFRTGGNYFIKFEVGQQCARYVNAVRLLDGMAYYWPEDHPVLPLPNAHLCDGVWDEKI